MPIVVAASLMLLAGCDSGITLTLNKPELQAGVDAYFPVHSKDYMEEELPANVVLSDPELILEEGSDRIGLRVAISADKEENAPDLPEGANPTSGIPPQDNKDTPQPPFGPPSGGPPGVPKPPTQPPVPENLRVAPPEEFTGTLTVSGKVDYRAEEASFYFLDPIIDDVSIDQLPPAVDQPVRETTSKILMKYFNENAIYTLSDEDQTSQAAKMLLKSVSIDNGQLKIVLGP